MIVPTAHAHTYAGQSWSVGRSVCRLTVSAGRANARTVDTTRSLTRLTAAAVEWPTLTTHAIIVHLAGGLPAMLAGRFA